jgi:transcriptional regulator GlxA family with amidase domain
MAQMTTNAQILPRTARSRGKPEIVFLTIPPIQVLDLIGPYEVFSRVARFGLAEGYKLTIAGAGRTEAACGLSIGPSKQYGRVRGPIDTLLIVGGEGIETRRYDRKVLDWLKRKAARVRRLGSVCTGAFLLADAGLLEGRNAVTHWAYCQRLAKEFPQINVQPEPIFIKDGSVYTSAGVTAGIDLALALVEEDYGLAVAQRIAKDLVLYMRRHGNQAQFSSLLTMQSANRQPIRDLIAWMNAHIRESITIESLAEQVAMSPRHFVRVFAGETGQPPSRFLEVLRVEAAKRMLESSDVPLKEIAPSCGLGHPSTLRRIFAKRLQLSPEDYRKRFRQK